MSNSGYVAFNPNDPVQKGFLASLALGETGNSAYAATEGVGGTDLANDPNKDHFGFPIWQGQGNSHAAGIFQFQPATWDNLASTYGLDFSNSSDQLAGAWYLAQQTYSSKTGANLYEDLSNGVTSNLNNSLASIWPSVVGNGASPHGLAAAFSGGEGADLPFPVTRIPTLRELAHLAVLNQHLLAVSLGRLKTGLNASV